MSGLTGYVLRMLPPPVKRRLLGSVVGYKVDGPPALALTFDDGPDPHSTPALLDLLDGYGARATFFLLGRNVDEFPAVAAAVVERGHAVGNHTYSHTSLVGLGRRAVTDEVARGQACIRRATGVRTRLFRPPHGSLDLTSYLTVRSMGLRPVLWSAAGQDWEAIPADEMVRRTMRGLAPGSIVLFHDGCRNFSDPRACDRSQMLAAVESLLRSLGAAGYRFLTLGEMRRFREQFGVLSARPAGSG